MAGADLATSAIDLEDLVSGGERFSFSCPTARESAELAGSLATFGLLRPLLGLKGADGNLTIAAGARRFELLSAVNVGTALVRVVDSATGADLPALWELLLEDHLLGGEPNVVEVGLYIKKRMADTGETLEELAVRVFERLGLTPRAQAGAEPLWVAGLSPVHRQRFAEEELPSKGLKTLTAAPSEDALAVLELTEGLKLGRNKFMEVARWVMECAWRDGSGVGQWLADLAGRADVANEAASPKLTAFTDKPLAQLNGEELRSLLWQLRYPTLAQWGDEFEDIRRKLELGKNTTLAHSPGFEGGKLRLFINFSSLEELRAELDKVSDKANEGELSPLKKFLS